MGQILEGVNTRFFLHRWRLVFIIQNNINFFRADYLDIRRRLLRCLDSFKFSIEAILAVAGQLRTYRFCREVRSMREDFLFGG